MAKIAIILWGYGLGNSPSLINMAKALVTAGFSVDIFTCRTFLGSIDFREPGIQIHDIKYPEGGTSILRNTLYRIFTMLIKATLNMLPLSVQIVREEKRFRALVENFVTSVALIIGQEKYAFFIGVEPLGMMAACLLGEKSNTPFVYYNMELHSFQDVRSINECAQKNIEVSFHRKALFTITQDEERAQIMSRENNVVNDTFVTIPVCANGEPFREKTDLLRQKLGLSSDKVIVIYAGFLAEWALCEELAIAAQTWPEEYVLVLHSHGYHDTDYVQKLRKYEGKNVRLSDTPVSYEDLPMFLASADIGIALYKNLGTNYTLIGSASGKIAHYLKSGLPIIVNSYPTISEMIDRFNCGVGVGQIEAVGAAIASICLDYSEMRDGAFRCYESKFRFSKHFEKVLQRFGVR